VFLLIDNLQKAIILLADRAPGEEVKKPEPSDYFHVETN